MRTGEYGVGIDVGDGTVSAAVCEVDGGPVVLRLGAGPVTVAVGDDGRVALVPAGGTAQTPHLVARVGDPVPVYAGARAVPAAELVAAAVQRVRELAEEQAGRPDAWTVVTVPPSWAGHRCAVLARALTAAGVPRFSLVSSAVAAVAAHLAAGDLPAEPTVAVYDLGARTLDTAVVGPTPDRPLDHLAVPPPPLPWGGRDVDDAVLAHVVECVGTTGSDAAALRRACATAKEALSAATAVRVADGPVRLTREELDEVLLEPARRSAGALAATVAAAGMTASDLDAVVLAGGGARVPLVAELLSGELGRPLVVGDDPALTAALGAAALAADALAVEPPAVAVPPAGAPVPVAADAEPRPVLPRPRDRRDRSRPAPAAGAAAAPLHPPGPAVRRVGRLGRGAVVTGLVLGLLLLGPVAAGLFDAVLAPPPAGSEAATGTDDGSVVARGSAAVGGSSSVPRDGATARGDVTEAAAGAIGTPARTSLAAAISTAALPGAAPVPGGASTPGTPTGSTARGSTAAAGTTTTGGTPAGAAPASSDGDTTASLGTATGAPGATTPDAPGGLAPSAPAPVIEQPPGTPSETGQSPAPGTPTGQTPVREPPTEQPPAPQPPPVQEPPPAQEPPPVEQTPVEPAPEQPPAQPAPEQPPAEQPATDPPVAAQPATEPPPAGDSAPDTVPTAPGTA